MALVLGTNCGFVSSAPSADPAAANGVMDNAARALKHTSPAGTNRITAIGIWIDNATEAGNIQFGLYSDAAAGEPEAQVQVTGDIAKGTSGGLWVSTAVDWELTASTAYWLAAALTDTATGTNTNLNNADGAGNAAKTTTPTLPADWGTSSVTDADGMVAIYAVYEAVSAGGALLPIMLAH